MARKAETPLPVFAARKHEHAKTMLIVTCPHEECGGEFLVVAARWYKPRRYRYGTKDLEVLITGRPCPYCSRVGRLPERARIR